MVKEILFASTNKGKIAEFQYVADYHHLPVKIVSVYHKFPQIHAYDEDYQTQEQIIDKGAHEIFSQVNEPIIVEDTIISVDVLDGRPGLTANDYLKEKSRMGLVEEMKGQENRNARITSIVGYYDGKLLTSFKKVVEGSITDKEIYKEGEPLWIAPSKEVAFGGGFNAIFLSKEANRTLADMTAEDGLTYGYREPNFKAVLEYILREQR